MNKVSLLKITKQKNTFFFMETALKRSIGNIKFYSSTNRKEKQKIVFKELVKMRLKPMYRTEKYEIHE